MDRRIGREGTGEYAKRRRKTPLPEEAERVRRWIRRTMKDQEITQGELAERIGMTQGQMCRIMTGCSEARTSTLVRMVQALGYRMVFVPEEQARKAEALRKRRETMAGRMEK